MIDDAMEQPLFDQEGAMERVDGDTELFFELVDVFFEDYESATSALESAIKSEENKAVEEQAHSIKSALGNIGAMRGFALSFELEKAGREERVTSDLMDVLEALKQAVDGYNEAVKKLKGEEA